MLSVTQVMWTRLYKKGTGIEKETPLQLKQLIDRTNVPCEPQKDINASEDSLEVIFVTHTIAAALSYFKMDNVSDDLDEKFAITTADSF